MTPSLPKAPPPAIREPWPLSALDRLATLPAELDGSRGANRFDGPASIAAANDYQAAQSWISQFGDSPATRRAYAKEAERLLLWAVGERGVPLSSLTVDDIQDYYDFLLAPPERWVGSSREPKASPEWRPLRGPLTEASLRQARTIVNSMFSWLVSARYLAGNPCALTRRRGRSMATRPTRYLRRPAWEFLLGWIDAMPEEPTRKAQSKARARHLCALLYLTAARLSDASGARMGDLRQEEDGSWWWRVVGKGAKESLIPATPELMSTVRAYRVFYGLAPLPSSGERTPLVMRLAGPVAGDALLSDNMVYRAIKLVFESAARDAEAAGSSDIAANLRDASTHWMRHTALTHQLEAGVDLLSVRDNARHASIATTSRYLWKDDRARHAQTSALHRLEPEREEPE